MSDEEKLAEARRICPEGYVIVPREASGIMAMRGAQAETGWFEPYSDCACEHFKFDEKGESKIEDALAPQNRWQDDEREYWLVASIWRGCIKGMEEWQRRREIEGPSDFITGWERPLIPALREWLARGDGQ